MKKRAKIGVVLTTFKLFPEIQVEVNKNSTNI